MKTRFCKLIAVIMMTGAIGCKDDVRQSDDAADADTSVVNDNTSLKDLSDEEMAAFCSEMFSASVDVSADLRDVAATHFCALAGRSAAQSVADAGGTAEDMALTCEMMVQNCDSGELDTMIQLMQGTSSLQTEGTFCAGLQDFFGDCDATTADMANCYLSLLESNLDQLESDVVALPACSAYTPEYFAAPVETDNGLSLTDVPFECMAVALKCPDMVMSVVSIPGL